MDGREFPDPAPNLKVNDVRQYMSSFYPELFEAEMKETKRGEDIVIEFIPPTFIDSHTVDEIRAHLQALAEITQPATPPKKEESREIARACQAVTPSATGAHRFLYDEGEMAEQRQRILEEIDQDVQTKLRREQFQQLALKTQEVVEEYITYKDDCGSAEGYLTVRARKLRFFARQHPTLPCEPQVLRGYLRQFRTDDVPTRQDQWKAVSDLYKFAAREYRIPNPMSEVEKPHFKKKAQQRLTREQTKHFIKSLKSDRQWAIATCFFGLRFRRIEGERLLWGDIRDDVIFVRGKVRDEDLPLHPVFKERLALRNGQSPNESYFGIKGDALAYHVEQMFKRAGIEGVRASPGTLRNTAARLWLTFGGDSRANNQLMRHGEHNIHDHYTTLSLDELMVMEDRFNPMLNLMRELGLAPPYPNTSSAQQP